MHNFEAETYGEHIAGVYDDWYTGYDQGARLYPVQLRYVWPAEFDLMAQLAGLRLKQRWSSWDRAAFSAESGKHISVFEHATA